MTSLEDAIKLEIDRRTQNRPPRLDPFRYFACVSWAWPVQGSKEAESAEKAGQVLPAAFLDTESPAGEWVLQRALALM